MDALIESLGTRVAGPSQMSEYQFRAILDRLDRLEMLIIEQSKKQRYYGREPRI